MNSDKTVEKLKRRYQRLASKLAGTGLILQGTITERIIKGEKNKEGEKIYGPYYQWTFKREGKTVTVNLTSKQAKAYQKAIGNQRNLEKTAKEMRVLSEQILEAETQAVKRRKSRK